MEKHSGIIDLPRPALDYKPAYALLLAVLVSFGLFFIDEGYYDLRWMKDIGNWLVFGIYVAGLFLAQQGMAVLLKWWFKPQRLQLVAALCGLPLGFLLMLVLFY